jgi:hypothetical protein
VVDDGRLMGWWTEMYIFSNLARGCNKNLHTE